MLERFVVSHLEEHAVQLRRPPWRAEPGRRLAAGAAPQLRPLGRGRTGTPGGWSRPGPGHSRCMKTTFVFGELTVQGKPVARRGRKARDLRLRSEAAQPPAGIHELLLRTDWISNEEARHVAGPSGPARPRSAGQLGCRARGWPTLVLGRAGLLGVVDPGYDHGPSVRRRSVSIPAGCPHAGLWRSSLARLRRMNITLAGRSASRRMKYGYHSRPNGT